VSVLRWPQYEAISAGVKEKMSNLGHGIMCSGPVSSIYQITGAPSDNEQNPRPIEKTVLLVGAILQSLLQDEWMRENSDLRFLKKRCKANAMLQILEIDAFAIEIGDSVCWPWSSNSRPE
jgi:hypothetical protein